MEKDNPIFDAIRSDIENNDVMLYIKGTPSMPQCGFSGVVVKILGMMNITYAYKNILDDPELREGIKIFSNWPTVPQLYLKAEFVGGCDIVREMYNSGEFAELLKQKEIPFSN